MAMNELDASPPLMKWSPEIERLWRTKYGYLAFVQTERDGELRMLRSVRDANGNRRQRPAGARKHVGVRRSCNAPDTIGILLKVSLRLCPSPSIRISLSLSFFFSLDPTFFFSLSVSHRSPNLRAIPDLGLVRHADRHFSVSDPFRLIPLPDRSRLFPSPF